ncbi:hypothetical protein Saa2_06945 [Streptomyces acidiscabies]|nr:hypothetical protein Saa2_06945 [Streptomyces acidiscabies]
MRRARRAAAVIATNDGTPREPSGLARGYLTMLPIFGAGSFL